MLAVASPVLGVPTPAAAQEEVAGDTVVGELVQAWPEHEDLAEARAHAHEGPLTWVETGSGAVRVPTGDLAAALGGTPEVPVGATVEVSVGAEVADPAAAEGLEPARDVLTAAVLEAAPSDPPTAAAAEAPTNEVTVVMLVPSGGAADGTTLAEVVAEVDGPVADFWAEQSDGAVRLGVVAGHDWTPTGADCADPGALWDAAASAAGWTDGPGRHLMVYLPRTSAGCAYGLAQVGTSPSSGGRLYVTDVVTSLVAHEFGHNLGLDHSSSLQCDGTVDTGTCRVLAYADLYDVMGASWDQVGSLAVSQAQRVGFLPAGQVHEVRSAGGGPVRLTPVSARTGIRAVRIDGPGGTVDWLEYRPPSGRDAWLGSPAANWPGLQPGVLLRREGGGWDDSSLLLDGTPSRSPGWDGDWASALPVGTPVPVASGTATVVVESLSADAAGVRVVPAYAGNTAITEAWAASGGMSGPLGPPTAGDVCGLRDGGCFRTFRSGVVYWTPATGAHLVLGLIWQRWAAQGWEWGTLGYPTTPTTCGLAAGGCFQHFQGGSVYFSPASGLGVVTGPVRDRWAGTGWERGLLGYPVGDQTCGARNRGCVQAFQHGAVYSYGPTGTHFVVGLVRQRWAAQGWEWGALGYPVTDTVCGLVEGGCFQHFEGGSVYFTPATGAQVVPRTIRDRWAGTGWERGPLGYPVADQACVHGRCLQHFQRGVVTSRFGGGQHVSRGGILDAWLRSGWAGGPLLHPVTDVVCGLRDGGCFQHFEGGSIYSGGAVRSRPSVVRGWIRDRWAESGWERGRLGYPVAEMICLPRCSQRFEGGTLTAPLGVY